MYGGGGRYRNNDSFYNGWFTERGPPTDRYNAREDRYGNADAGRYGNAGDVGRHGNADAGRYGNAGGDGYNRGGNYGGYDGSGNYVSYNRPAPSSLEYYYGGRRRRPYFWDRDRTAYYRLWGNRNRRSRGSSRSSRTPPVREYSPEREPEPRPEPPREEFVKQLQVKGVDFNINENTEINKTDKFECTDGVTQTAELVVRRGNFMKISIRFDRPYDKTKHDLKLCFSIGKNASVSNGTLAEFTIDEDGKQSYDPFQWGSYLYRQSGNDIDVIVHMAADSIVGEWNVSMKTYSYGKDRQGNDKKLVFKYEHPEDIYILFNPWCKDDGVYMRDSRLLNEYVLNENGYVYRGSHRTIGEKSWNFGQFELGILDVCLYLLRAGFKNGISKEMADPVAASRIIVKMVNSADDDGVLTGNWSGDYTGGTPPTKWVGSPRILKEFIEGGTVKFGQCWVFSAITTTVCRCLGIPCRSVTNFESAHDTDASNLIEKVRNTRMEVIKHNGDSVWNFHVWNEVWLARPDIKENGFDGWQVIDATPQELSDGVYTCGPCPVVAVKNGRVDIDYDTSFVFSEVNADVANYIKHSDGTYELASLEKDKIGKNISTTAADGRTREDITLHYKYPEGSQEERMAVKQAFEIAKRNRIRYTRKPILDPYAERAKDGKVTLSLNFKDEVMIGSDFPLEVVAVNESYRVQRVMYIGLRVSSQTYTGERGSTVFQEALPEFDLEPDQKRRFKFLITAREYFPRLLEQASLSLEAYYAVGSPSGGTAHQESVVSEDFRFRRPDLDVQGPQEGKRGVPVKFKVSFRNPTPVLLTNCIVAMGSSGFRDVPDERQRNVQPGEVFTATFTMVPKRTRRHEVLFEFDSRELKDISGSTSIMIY